ncbi:MAG TPA: hypothetical protein VGO62_06635, partial [Myxococcota bacterium]
PGTLEIYVNGIARPFTASATALTLDDAVGTLTPNPSDAASPDPIVRVNHPIVGLPTTEGDLVVVVLSKNGTGLGPTGGGAAFCYSAPLYVDVDGDGAFTPWLAATQTLAP